MNLTLPKANLIKKEGNLLRILLLMVFVSTSALSIKAAYDLTKESEIFPVWFVPSFILTIIFLLALSLFFVLQVQKIESNIHMVDSRWSTSLWILMLLSFICTTSVHGFYPFHRNVLRILPAVDSVMKANYAIAIIGFVTCVVLAYAYILGQMKHSAMIGLMLISLLMLIPNDNCANPFNYWWIDTIGASPLMYVPNMYAALFVTCGLYGVLPKSAGFLIICICLGSLLLGLGHQLGIIW
jgi:hypothetical protein